MNILILGDIVGPSGREGLRNNLKKLLEKKKSTLLLRTEKTLRTMARESLKRLQMNFLKWA